MLAGRQDSPIEYGELKLEPNNSQSGTGHLSTSKMYAPEVKMRERSLLTLASIMSSRLET